jgi:LDH2 family malate/lactate/ureidoglycolate dehydrogenase
MPNFQAARLRRIAAELLKRAGATAEEAEVVAESLIEADLHGYETHGLMRLGQYLQRIRDREIKLGAKPVVMRETPTTVLLDGRWGFGQVTAREAMSIAISKAETHSIGLAAAYNCNHLGRLGEYASLSLTKDMIGFAVCNDYPGVAPYGSIDPLMGTNPLAIAIPAGSSKAIILDMATSAVSGGRVRLAKLKGERIPLGWIIDKQGKPSTDPADLHGATGVIGALLPFGGYKGSGLGIIIEILAGALAGSGCSFENKGSGLVVGAVKIETFSPIDVFKASVDRFTEKIKRSRKGSGFEKVFLPGERAQKLREQRLRKGIPIQEGVWEAVKAKAEEFGVKL